MAYPIKQVTRPAVLAGQENGKLPDSILMTTPGQEGGARVRLVEPAGRAWRAFASAAKGAGHVLKIGWENSAFRPYADQERIFLARYTTTPNGTRGRSWRGQTWYKKPGVAAAAVPGTSNHGWGLAVDVGEESDGDIGTESLDSGTLRWMLDNADRFGWSWELQSEPWHIRYWAGDDIPDAVLAYEQTSKQGTSTMYMIRLPNGRYRVVLPGLGYTDVSEPSHWQKVILLGQQTGVYMSEYMDQLLSPEKHVTEIGQLEEFVEGLPPSSGGGGGDLEPVLLALAKQLDELSVDVNKARTVK